MWSLKNFLWGDSYPYSATTHAQVRPGRVIACICVYMCVVEVGLDILVCFQDNKSM